MLTYLRLRTRDARDAVVNRAARRFRTLFASARAGLHIAPGAVWDDAKAAALASIVEAVETYDPARGRPETWLRARMYTRPRPVL